MKRIFAFLLCFLMMSNYCYADWANWSVVNMQTDTVSTAIRRIQESLSALDGTSEDGIPPTNLITKNLQLKGATSGTVTITPAAVSGTTTLTVPATNGTVVVYGNADIDIGSYELRAQTLESDVATGTAPMTIASTTKVSNLNVDSIDGYDSTTAFSAATKIPVTESTGRLPVGIAENYQLFTSDGNWTCPAGVNKVYITAVGGGGGGGSGSGNQGGGGGGGGALIKYAYTVTPTTVYAVDIGAGGAGGSVGGADGTAGSNTTFNTEVVALGGAKGEGSTGTSAGGAGGGGFDAVTTTAGGYNLKGGNGAITAGGGTIFGIGAISNQAATANTGAGGGGGGDGSPGYAGGSGILIVEW